MTRFLILFLFITLAAGCKKDLSTRYAFDLNGVTYRGDNYNATYHLDTLSGLQEFAANFYIGNITDTNYVQVSFSGSRFIGPGTYYSGITNPYSTVCSFAYNKSHTYYTNVTGIVQITQIDTIGHNMKGSFQFKAVNTLNSTDTVWVTNGGFSGINYVIE